MPNANEFSSCKIRVKDKNGKFKFNSVDVRQLNVFGTIIPSCLVLTDQIS